MKKDELIAILNTGINGGNGIFLIQEYLRDKNIEEYRIKEFLTLVRNDLFMQINNVLGACATHAARHFMDKHNVCTLKQNNKTLLYY